MIERCVAPSPDRFHPAVDNPTSPYSWQSMRPALPLSAPRPFAPGAIAYHAGPITMSVVGVARRRR
jgi:hypothetical protein